MNAVDVVAGTQHFDTFRRIRLEPDTVDLLHSDEDGGISSPTVNIWKVQCIIILLEEHGNLGLSSSLSKPKTSIALKLG
jgi:hypothetical protein